MFDVRQLRLLKSGVGKWNRWRNENPRAKINLQGADLRRTDLRRARLQQANLGEANLEEVNFRLAELQGTDLRGAVLGRTQFAAISYLARSWGLKTCTHLGPSSVDHVTLQAAQGQLPETFLKGCGFQDWEIENAKLHNPTLSEEEIIDVTYRVARMRGSSPIDVRPLFISYSQEDEAFVDFIEAKLDADGIRYWRDKHDLVAGPLEAQIDAAIRLNQTVLLVLSENSLDSDWVKWELDKAKKLEKELRKAAKEDRERRELLGEPQEEEKEIHVLCPVDIDGSWKKPKWDKPFLKRVKEYNILDFSKWETNDAEDSYQKLKAGIAKYYGG